MKVKLPRVNGHNLLLFFFAVAFLLQSMALYHQKHYPMIVVHNPATNIAELANASRHEDALKKLMTSGFVQACAMLTASHPFEFPDPGVSGLNEALLRQYFSTATGTYVQTTRAELGLYQERGTIRLIPDESKLKIGPVDGSLYFEGFFTREIPTGSNTHRYSQFQIKALGNLAPVTRDNPFGIKFTKIHLIEIDPKSIRSTQ